MDKHRQEPGWVAEVLGFWFEELSQQQWFAKDAALDARIRARFGALQARLVESRARIIERFGRFPHRNAALGRESTPAELELLTQPIGSF